MKPLKMNRELVTDRVMGGVSSGEMEQITINELAAIRMTGWVSLDNNGGFVQMATGLSPPPANAKGIALQLIGNTEIYNIDLRTSDLIPSVAHGNRIVRNSSRLRTGRFAISSSEILKLIERTNR